MGRTLSARIHDICSALGNLWRLTRLFTSLVNGFWTFPVTNFPRMKWVERFSDGHQNPTDFPLSNTKAVIDLRRCTIVGFEDGVSSPCQKIGHDENCLHVPQNEGNMPSHPNMSPNRVRHSSLSCDRAFTVFWPDRSGLTTAIGIWPK